MFFSLAFAASLVASASAHATFQALWVNGVDQGSWCVRLPQSNSPVTSVTSNDIACNANAHPASGLCAINPGDTLTVEMHQQPGDRSCANEAIGGDHYGPINIYMAKVDDAASAAGYEQSWFKVDEMGMPSNNPDFWATEVLNDNCGHFTFTVPSNIAPGNYLLRAEVIDSQVGGAQFYMSCFQLQVGGSGSVTPAGVKFPGAYSATDPGILINIYSQLNTYQIPGPSPFASPSPAAATTAWPTTATWNTASQPKTIPTTAPPNAPAAPAQPSTSAPANPPSSPSTSKPASGSSTSAPASTPSSPSGTVAQYGQCGGQGWTGATACVAPYTCHVLNDYYSQCY